MRYDYLMIKSFQDAETEKIWWGDISKKLPQNIQQVARRKLRMLNNAHTLEDLRVPPADRLEARMRLGSRLKQEVHPF